MTTVTCGGAGKREMSRAVSTRTVSKLPTDRMDLGPYIAAAGWTQHPSSGEQQLMRSLLHFDLRVLPTNAVVQKATLYLHAHRKNYIGNIGNPMYGSRNEVVFELASGRWDPANVTWAGQPAGIEEGGRKLKRAAGTKGDDSVDITGFVRGWAAKPNENYGMIMRLEQERTYGITKTAHSSADGAVERKWASALANSRIYYSEKAPDSLQPKLVIRYTLPAEDKVRLYPVPASGSLTLAVGSDKSVRATYEIIDATGRIVSVQDAAVIRGENMIAVKGIAMLDNGSYTLRLRMGERQAVKHFIILK